MLAKRQLPEKMETENSEMVQFNGSVSITAHLVHQPAATA
jgi:hypothetical protein